VTDGLLERGGGFVALGPLQARVIEARFRRLVLGRLHRAERLSERFLEVLLGWKHSGFSVHVGAPVEASEPRATEQATLSKRAGHRPARGSMERVGRYLVRAPVSHARIQPQADGRVKLLTPVDPATGKDSVVFDPLDWVHAVTTQIPDPRRHLVRYYGSYANRARRLYRPCEEAAGGLAGAPRREADPEGQEAGQQARRRSWARLLRRIYEVDPLLCPRCGHALEIVAVITDVVVVDAILEHRRSRGVRSPFEPRAPPAA